MTADLAALGLFPSADHPDAELFDLVDKRMRRHNEWNDARGERAHRRLLQKWAEEGAVDQDQAIARFVPVTLEGLVAKAESALQAWREDDGPDRYKRMWATTATALEQAMRILQAQRIVEMPTTDAEALS